MRFCVAMVTLSVLAAASLADRASGAFEVAWPDARTAATAGDGTLVGRVLREAVGLDQGTLEVSLSGGQLFGLRDASGGSAVLSARLGGVPFCALLTTLGGELYQERVAAAGVAWAQEGASALAVSVRCGGIRARGVDDLWCTALDIGVARRLLGRVVVSARGENVTRTRIGESPVASRTRVGIALELDSARLTCGALLEGGFSPALVTGMEAELSEWLRVRAGARHAPGMMAFGLGLGKDSGGPWPEVDVAWQWHPRLGVSSFVSITFVL